MTQMSENLWEEITSLRGLNAAWSKVDRNEGSAGGDRVSRSEFRDDLFARLNQLRAELLEGSYKSRPFKKVSIPKKKPGYRILTIPAIRDRVLHTSIANALTPMFEPTFEDSSFGYRPGRGVTHAVAGIEKWRSQGYVFVIEADIVSYFDNIEHQLLLEKVESTLGQKDGTAPFLQLLHCILNDQAHALGTTGVGLVQGSPLSPLLANLYLDALDEEIEAQGVKLVRFADDFVILCKSEKKAKKVLAHCAQTLAEHGLRLHEDGTRIVNFDKGFDFIGYLFLKTLSLKKQTDPKVPQPANIKSDVTDEGIIQLGDEGSNFDPGRKVLYVLESNHALGIRNRSFAVTREDGREMIAIPNKRIGRIEIGPNVAFSSAAVILAMDTDIDISVVDGLGQSKGRIHGRSTRMGGLHLDQAKAVLDVSFRTTIARAIVRSRIVSQRTQLARLNRTRKIGQVKQTLQTLKQIKIKLDETRTVEQAMGTEGSATRIYWAALGCLHEDRSNTEFTRERPARTPLNATINYLTGMLERDIRAAIQRVGLHLGFAFLHGSRNRHDGLVFDLMEPFRAPLTEGLSVFLFSSGRLKTDMFSQDEMGRSSISAEGRAAIVNGYETAVSRRIRAPDKNRRLPWRTMMFSQAQSLARAIAKPDHELFFPFALEGGSTNDK